AVRIRERHAPSRPPRAPNLGDVAPLTPGSASRVTSPLRSRPHEVIKVEPMPISVAVAGASGYAGGELLRLLADHPEFEIRVVTAHSNAGQRLGAVQPHLLSLAELELQPTEAKVLAEADVVF